MNDKRHIPWQVSLGFYGFVLGLAAGCLVSPDIRATGLCTSRFMGDIAGVLQLHNVEGYKYVPPEFLGIVLGAFLTSILFKEWKGYRSSTYTPLAIRFIIGTIIVYGSLVFIGCPVRAYIRLGSGDLNAIAGIAGLIIGITVGIFFLRKGFTLRDDKRTTSGLSWIFPVAIIIAAAIVVFGIFSQVKLLSYSPSGIIQPIFLVLAAGLLIGFLAQRSRFCTVSAVRDAVLGRELDYLVGIIGFVIGVFLVVSNNGNYTLNFNQPYAQPDQLVNFLSLFVVGIGSTLIGGCPFRQLIKASQGDLDAVVVILGMLFGAGATLRFGLYSTHAGPPRYTLPLLICSILFLFGIIILMRERN